MSLPAKHNPRKVEHPKESIFGLPFPCLCLRHLLSKEHLRKASSIPEINRNAKPIGKEEYMLIIISQWELSWGTYWTFRAELPVTLHLCLAAHLLCLRDVVRHVPECSMEIHENTLLLFFFCERQILDFKHSTVSWGKWVHKCGLAPLIFHFNNSQYLLFYYFLQHHISCIQ